MLTVRIDERVRLRGTLDDEVVQRLQRAFTYDNPDYAKAQVFGFYKRVPRHLMSWTAPRGGQDLLTIARGGYDRARAILTDAGVPYRLEDVRLLGQLGTAIPRSRITARDYQQRLIDVAVRAFERGGPAGVCLWRSPQASGKTTAALILATVLQRKTLVVISNRVLQRQWCARIADELGIRAGVIGGGKMDLAPPIVVAMQQSLKNVAQRDLERFGLLIGDEIQLFAARTFQESVDRFPGLYRLGVSGDERRADKKECLIYDQFGDVAAEVKADELLAAGRIHEVEVRVVPTRTRCDWWRELGELQPRLGESYDQAVQRRVKARVHEFDRLSDEIGADPDRNALVVALARQAVADAGQVLVLAGRREHCHRLDAGVTAAGLSSGLLIGGEDYREQFERTLRLFSAAALQVAVGTYQAVGVGFDVPAIARGICASPVASGKDGDKQWRQYRGRFARTADGKIDAVLYYLWDVEIFGLKPLRHLVRWNARVVVLDGADWIPARAWIDRWRSPDGTKTQRPSRPTPARGKRRDPVPTGPVPPGRQGGDPVDGGHRRRRRSDVAAAAPDAGERGPGRGLDLAARPRRKRSEVGDPGPGAR